MTMLRLVLYTSECAKNIDERAIQAILARSRINNWRLDVTGVLVYSGTHFAQVLEGRPQSVETMLEKISRDRRHSKVRVLLDNPTELRSYGDWAMGYLYREDVASAVQDIAAQTRVSAEEAAAVAGMLRPDTVMGSL